LYQDEARGDCNLRLLEVSQDVYLEIFRQILDVRWKEMCFSEHHNVILLIVICFQSMVTQQTRISFLATPNEQFRLFSLCSIPGIPIEKNLGVDGNVDVVEVLSMDSLDMEEVGKKTNCFCPNTFCRSVGRRFLTCVIRPPKAPCSLQ